MLRIVIAILGLLAWPLFAMARAPATTTDLFEQVKPAVIQVRILNVQTNQQSSLGSGFFVSERGLAVTNFHVVSDVVHHPERYRAEYLDELGGSGVLRVLNVDVLNDVAIVKADIRPAAVLAFAKGEMRKGERLLSVGNPRDLGLTIVEGSFSGLLQGSFYQRIHYTGSLNPGMSGGPTINADRAVVGVNVATAGNQISFLVAAQVARALLERSVALIDQPPQDFTALVRDQLKQDQAEKFDRLLDVGFQATPLGPFHVPISTAPFLRCWGDTSSRPTERYAVQTEECTVDDSTYIAADHQSTPISFRHDYIDGKKLNRWAFSSLLETFFDVVEAPKDAAADHVTPFRCEARFMESNDLKFKVAICLRSFKEYEGLYDFVFKGVTLSDQAVALHTELVLGGVSMESAERVLQRYLETIK